MENAQTELPQPAALVAGQFSTKARAITHSIAVEERDSATEGESSTTYHIRLSILQQEQSEGLE